MFRQPHPPTLFNTVDGAIPLPHGIKFLIASFPEAFGTADGRLVQKWCVDNGWVLVWALGSGQVGSSHHSFTNGAFYSYNHRAVDPDVIKALGTATNATAVSSASKSKFDALWTEVARLRNTTAAGHGATTLPLPLPRRTREDVFRELVANPAPPPLPQSALNFTALWQEMPPMLATAPLSAGQCAEPARCIGTWVSAGGSDCICYRK